VGAIPAIATPRAAIRAAYNDRVPGFAPLTSPLALDAVWEASRQAPVILFKHSESCGASLWARTLLGDADVPVPVHEIVVQRHRDVSNAVASTLGVRHESPQVIVVAAGRAVWHTSHAGVAAERVAHAWHEAARR
jgi:bacillithiol system protein YtxJ